MCQSQWETKRRFIMANKIKCINCIHAQEDKKASQKNWTAYECDNPESVFYKSLLNVRPDGGTIKHITWGGCKHGKAVKV